MARALRFLSLAPVLMASMLTVTRPPIIAPPSSSDAPAAQVPAVVHFDTDRTTVSAGRTRVIAFRVANPRDVDTILIASIDNPTILKVLREPAVLSGQSIGYVRVRGQSPGTATLTVAGVSLHLDVIPLPGADGLLLTRPQIVGPADGAVVWARFAVGVDLWRPGPDPVPNVQLQLSNGQRLAPSASVDVSPPDEGPRRRLYFEVDADSILPGPLTLRVIDPADNSGNHTSVPVTVRVARPEAADIAAGEAEQAYDVERPKRFKNDKVRIGTDPFASGGKFFDNAGAEPALCFPIEVPSPGLYQMFIVASGTYAGGALPTVGLVVDGADYPATNARLLAEPWHRLAVGVPIRLDAGMHLLTPHFENDFYVSRLEDRNLRLDRLEVARVGAASTPASSGGDAMNGAMNGAMNAMSAQMGAMAAGGGARDAADDGGFDPFAPQDRFHIALPRPLDGLAVTGDLEVQAVCRWEDPKNRPPPSVKLLVNGKAVCEQRAGAPRFSIDTGALKPGSNTIQFVATLDTGAVAGTPVQTVTWNPPATWPAPPKPRTIRRFTVLDPRWDPAILALLKDEHRPPEGRAAAFYSNGHATLTLPEELAGTFDLSIEAFGTALDGPPIAAVSLVTDGQTTQVAEVKVPGGWGPHAAGSSDLKPGPKQLIVAFTNDLYDPQRGDRNLWLQSVILRERRATPDKTPPAVAILYPADGQTVGGAGLADAVVASVCDDGALDSAELLIDGKPTALRLMADRRPGPFVFPLLLRNFAPGRHTIAVRALDAAKNAADCQPRTITVADPASPQPGAYERAVRLLDRLGLGPDAGELTAILTMGEQAWLADRLSRPLDDAGDLAALGMAYQRFGNPRSEYDVPRLAIHHAMLTPNPVRAHFVLWAENHFSTWIRKTEGQRKFEEHAAFTRLGIAPFPDLLFASATSPAMLRYLDQDNSFARRLNENYAREIMELHTLGVAGGYSQTDVTSLAALLTGWMANAQGDGHSGGPGNTATVYGFAYDPRLNQPAPTPSTRILGMEFGSAAPDERYDRAITALEMLCAHPSAAHFICRKLAEHYVAAPAPDAMVDDLAGVFKQTNGDMRAVITAMAAHQDFWAPAPGGSTAPALRLTPPLYYALRLARTTRRDDPNGVGDFLQRSGQGLFDRPTPDGYPEQDAASMDSNALLQRWRLAQEFEGALADLVPPPWRSGKDPLSDADVQWAIDLIAVRLTGRVLSAQSSEAAVSFAAAARGTRDEKVRALGVFIAQLPEASLR